MSGYSLAHFLVDMGCAMLLYHMLSLFGNGAGTETAVLSVLVYDFFAFVTELPMGVFLDRFNPPFKNASNINGLIAGAGCAIIGAVDICEAFDMIPLPLFIPAAVITGIANAAFHLGAGLDVIAMSERKASLSGVFISTGALGLFLGTNAQTLRFDKLLLTGSLLLAISLFLFWQYFHDTLKIQNYDHTIIKTGSGCILLAVSLLFLVIVYRSFLGFASKYSWRSGLTIGLVAVSAVFLGKFTGGIAADLFGWKKTTMLSLSACAFFALFSDTSPLAGCLVLFLFNTTMPVAMMGLANILTRWKGAAFGLNTTALFLGFIICHIVNIPVTGTAFCIMIVLSAAILLAALSIAPETET